MLMLMPQNLNKRRKAPGSVFTAKKMQGLGWSKMPEDMMIKNMTTCKRSYSIIV
jgi:hypothetical protein